MRCLAPIVALTLTVGLSIPAYAQDGRPLYRVFLTDGTPLVSFGEWARVGDRLVFSMPLTTGHGPSDLHLVSLPLARVDLARSERYAEAVRAANYAATQGETDFARLSSDVADVLNRVALISDPVARLNAAEEARRSLTEWLGTHYGYRAAEVREIVGVLDGLISGLRAGAGQDAGRFDLSLSATTDAVFDPLIDPPDQTAVVEQLMAASAVVDSPTEKVSLLQSVIALLDRAVELLPTAFAATVRSVALAEIVEEKRVDAFYARLRTTILSDASRHAERANVRKLQSLRQRVQDEDGRLGGRRPEEVAAVLATIDAHLDAAHRLRLAQDQWRMRRDGLRAYERASLTPIKTLAQAADSLDDIRVLAGPTPQRLRPLAVRLSRAAGRLALVKPPAELSAAHAILRSAYELAENAVKLRLDAAAAADVELARQAAAAASGALMLLARGRADIAAALRPPVLGGLVSQP